MQVKAPGGNRQLQYRCVSVNCGNISASFKRVEEKLILELENKLNELILEDQQRIRNGVKSEDKKENLLPQMIEQNKKDLVQLEEQEDNLDTLLEKGLYDIDKYSKRSKKLREEIKSKQESIKLLIAQNEQIKHNVNSLIEEIEVYSNVVKYYKMTKDVFLKNKLLKTIIDKNIIYIRKSKYDDVELHPLYKKF